MDDRLLQSKRAIITNYFKSGFTYDEILRVFLNFTLLNMNEHKLATRLSNQRA